MRRLMRVRKRKPLPVMVAGIFASFSISARLGAFKALFVALVMICCSASTIAQSREASVNFPTSGSGQAQSLFIRGVVALHNFWYEEAADIFRQAQRLDPNFAMAYWGEAMTYNHPLWAEQNLQNARRVLARLGADQAARADKASTAREKAYLGAIEILFGEGDKFARDVAYSRAMEKLSQEYSQDVEASSFYALSHLGTVRQGDVGFDKQAKAAAILEKIFESNPNHPGAVHYIIHAYDDPEHARLGLAAARRYAEIAALAPHALHMPSHIFVQLGMWDEVASSNEAAFKASDDWVKAKGLSITRRDYHSLSWMHYAYLQQGRYSKARELLAMMRRLAEVTDDYEMNRVYASIAAMYAIENGQEQSVALPGERYDEVAGVLLAKGVSGARNRNLVQAQKAAAALQALRAQNEARGNNYVALVYRINENEITASILAMDQPEKAGELLKETVALEARMDPPSGIPEPMKPSAELYGEILLQLKKPDLAAVQFEAVLQRMPNRSAAVIGAARAYATMGDQKSAAKYYSQFLNTWRLADPDLPQLLEARSFVSRSEAR